MKKFLLGLSMFTSALLADPGVVGQIFTPLVTANNQIVYFPEDVTNNYGLHEAILPFPTAQGGYIQEQVVFATQTSFIHAPATDPITGEPVEILVDVYIPNPSPNEYITVHEISMHEWVFGVNERTIDDGLTVSQYKVLDETNNGVQRKLYRVPDLSNDMLRVRVTTCPKWDKPTEVECTHILAYIHGSAPYSTTPFTGDTDGF